MDQDHADMRFPLLCPVAARSLDFARDPEPFRQAQGPEHVEGLVERAESKSKERKDRKELSFQAAWKLLRSLRYS